MSLTAGKQLLLSSPAGGYQVSRSLRFNSADSAYLSRTPASAGNRKTWTWSGWVKLAVLTGNVPLFGIAEAGNDSNYNLIRYASGALRFSTWSTEYRITTAVYRDPSAWYHVVVALDTANATADDRIKIYINGVRETSFSTSNTITQNTDFLINSGSIRHAIGGNITESKYFDGYMAECHFIDGSAKAPGDFAETDATTGQWIPKLYSGSYGTNGFKLTFADNSAATAAALGKDTSGNSNNWTPNNFSVTAGAGNDSLTDTPTSYGTDTGAGGEVRGNFCTWNPLLNNSSTASTLSNGNLDVTTATTGGGLTAGTIAVSSGKWYWELTVTSVGSNPQCGILSTAATVNNSYPEAYYGNTSGFVVNLKDNLKYNPNGSTYGSGGLADNDVIGVALDLDAGTLVFYVNNSSRGTAFSSISGTFTPIVGDGVNNGGSTFVANFGQRAFAYTPPANHKPLVDTYLPSPVVAKSDQAFQTVIWTGDGSSSRAITGLSFSPDLLWVKRRNSALDHFVWDSVRGVTKELYTNQTYSEGTASNKLSSFDTNGFTVQNNSAVNALNDTYVGWVWDAGATTSSNGSGSITSSVRANASAGFSIVTYTGAGSAGSTVGHGGLVNLTNGMIIIKQRNSASNWWVGHGSQGWTKAFEGLNTTAAISTTSAAWNNTAPSSTVFTLGTETNMNGSGNTYVAYCFAPVAGYSSFGSYVGNGSSDGPFVYTGFRPKWLLYKDATAASDWAIVDATRGGYNVIGPYLLPNSSGAEGTATIVDFTANGFKIRNSGAGPNGSGNTHIYAAFAESPFQYARAR